MAELKMLQVGVPSAGGEGAGSLGDDTASCRVRKTVTGGAASVRLRQAERRRAGGGYHPSQPPPQRWK